VLDPAGVLGNYDVTYNTANFTITPKAATVTADNRSKIFGELVTFAGTEFTTSGFINGDGVTSVTLTSAGAAAAAMVVGSPYAIIPSAAVGTGLGNYAITYVNGSLTIGAWTLNGFYQPVGIPNSVHTAPGAPLPTPVTGTIFNSIKGGQTVPLKFNVFAGAIEKTSVADIKSFTVLQVGCISWAPEDSVDFTTTGGTSLRYDTDGKQFIQNWKTPNGAGKCYRATMTAEDGSSISAFFKTK
jgi:hypothetical protein